MKTRDSVMCTETRTKHHLQLHNCSILLVCLFIRLTCDGSLIRFQIPLLQTKNPLLCLNYVCVHECMHEVSTRTTIFAADLHVAENSI